jgi:hypothetical protein
MSTSINELPTDPTGGGTIGGNVSMSVSEQNSMNQGQGQGQGMNNNMSLDQTTINQIVNGLQQASSSGATQLASRDIPRNVDGMVSDPQIQPTYVPQTNNQDYIKDYDENDDIIRNYEKKEQYVKDILILKSAFSIIDEMFVKEMENAEVKKTYWYRIWFFCNYGMDEKTKDPRKLNQFIEDIMDPYGDKNAKDLIKLKVQDYIKLIDNKNIFSFYINTRFTGNMLSKTLCHLARTYLTELRKNN